MYPNLFREAGWPAWLTLFALLVGLMLSITAMVVRRNAMTITSWVFSLGPIATGALGYYLGLVAIEGAVAFVDPGMREGLVAQGTFEAFGNVYLGGMCAAVLVLPNLLATMFTAKRNRQTLAQ